MPIRRSEVLGIAALARLEVTGDGVDRTVAELARILEFVERMRVLDAGADPAPPDGAAGDGLREDATGTRGLTAESALAMAPEAADGFFLIPPVLEAGEP
jgi:aspartyl-tRNA(Asn)/glutamyl-tRNA(Gln) amidotransferase subunit C